MAYYDPHKNPNIRGEMDLMDGRGRLVKVRFLDQPVPNVSWFWFTLGNCTACKFFTSERCLNPKISPPEFVKYQHASDCPEFAAGVSDELLAEGRQDRLDVMKAVGLVPGTPGQKIHVIRDEAWTSWRAVIAHREQSAFLNMARDADHAARTGVPVHPADGDLSDDLERPVGHPG